MNRNVVAIVLSLAAGAAAATIVLVAAAPDSEPPPQGPTGDPDRSFDPSASMDERIRALEAAVAEERNARQLLEDELQTLYDEIEVLGIQRQADEEQLEARQAVVAAGRQRFENMRAESNEAAAERRIATLVEAGFSAERAEWILKRESELQMEAMQARFDARMAGEAVDPFEARMNPASGLRDDIGDAEYEKYLQASGRPTSVSVGTVYESSPAQRAGLQPGDEIVSYAGVRVFDSGDLNRQTMAGDPGESVVVDFVRDGVPMQVVIPRGPIGVAVGRGPWGRR